MHEKKIGNVKDLLLLLEEVVRIGKPLLMIAGDVEAEARQAHRRCRGDPRWRAVRVRGEEPEGSV